MTAQERLELQQIHAEQADLRTRLAELEDRIERLESHSISEKVSAASGTPTPVIAAQLGVASGPPALPIAPPTSPPPLPPMDRAASVPPPPPWLSSPGQPSTVDARNVWDPLQGKRGEVGAVPVPPGESLEMRIGGTWFVRVGIVLLLTSLAFLGSYLYTNVLEHLGAVGKIGLLYVGAGALAGTGALLERGRQARDSARLRQYAGVLLAGGLAAVYYVTYAAHHFAGLRVIDSPLLAGALLLGWAAFMVWLAARRGSESLATIAILLAYYTSAINEGVAGFTLASNLFLSGAAVFLLRRHLWRVFPFASLLASYGSYAFWNYFHSYLGWRGLAITSTPAANGAQFWVEGAFLSIYWALFTWAAFTASDEALPRPRRAAFVGLNNGAFFLLTTWLLLAQYPHAFWKWSLGFGVVLLALAEIPRARDRQQTSHETAATYLVEGLLLVTLGFVSYFSGWQLSLALATQTVALAAAARARRSELLLGCAGGSALLSFFFAMHRFAVADATAPWALALAEGGFLLLAAWIAQRSSEESSGEQPPLANEGHYPRHAAIAPACFSLLGLTVWLWAILLWAHPESCVSPALAIAGVVLTAGGVALRIRSIPLYAQLYLLAAYVRWMVGYGVFAGYSWAPPIWNPLIILAATLLLGHWWQRQLRAGWLGSNGRPIAAWDAFLLCALLFLWLHPRVRNERWMLEGAAVALALLTYGLATNYRSLAAAGQLLIGSGAFILLTHWQRAGLGYNPEMWLAFAPVAAMALTLVLTQRTLPDDARQALERHAIPAVYEAAALLLFIVWGTRYVPPSGQFALFACAGGAIFAAGIWRGCRRWLLLSAGLTLTSLWIFWIVYEQAERSLWIHLLGATCFGGQAWWSRKQQVEHGEIVPRLARNTLIAAATLCTWGVITAGMQPLHGTFTLAAGWSLYAAVIFGIGLCSRERMYRWLACLILAVTLGRIALVDLWQLNSLERAVSAFCLAVILLSLGFFYNRYHEAWRDIL